MKKKLSCLLLTLLMVVSLMPAASAANANATKAAETLYELGLFRGTGTNPDGTPIFDLDKTPTRNQAVIMLVRLLGKEQEALNGTWDLPFTDVAKGSTVYPYIGYAYANGLTFVLRAMGYESGKDFEVGTAWELSDKLGITHNRYNAVNAASFLRSDVAFISASALSAQLQGSKLTLADKLMVENVFTKAQYERATGQADKPSVPQGSGSSSSAQTGSSSTTKPATPPVEQPVTPPVEQPEVPSPEQPGSGGTILPDDDLSGSGATILPDDEL